MKEQRVMSVLIPMVVLLVVAVGLAYAQGPEPPSPQVPRGALGMAFTYQGQLKLNGEPVNDECEMEFRLYDDASAGNPVSAALTHTVAISDGLFTQPLDFGAGVFTGDARWLGIRVQCQGDASFADLGRQELTAVPYATYALVAPWSGLTDVPLGFADGVDDNTTYNAGTGLALLGNTFHITTTYRLPQGCSAGETAQWNDTQGIWECTPSSSGEFWSLWGNAGLIPGQHVLGTLGPVSLTLVVDTVPTLRLAPADGAPNLLGGYPDNQATAGAGGAVIGGGGGFGSTNGVSDHYGTVGGGLGNWAGDGDGDATSAVHATVGGGVGNSAAAEASTVGGGEGNLITAPGGTIGGGVLNTVSGGSSTVGGGADNTVSGTSAVIAGGETNDASGSYSVIAGGLFNIASGLIGTVGGGFDNQAVLTATVVGGGEVNLVNGSHSFIGGGYFNQVTNAYAAVVGGRDNSVTGLGSTVGGGQDNLVTGGHATVAGGWNNTANAFLATVSGGAGNISSDWGATVGGGESNYADGIYATVGGGYSNTVVYTGTTIAGGRENLVTGQDSTIGGGVGNQITDERSTIGGGLYNQIDDVWSTIGGGSNNTIDDRADSGPATIGGGISNVASGYGATVGGGSNNTAENYYSTVPGGAFNVASGDASFAAGRQASATHDGAFVWNSWSMTGTPQTAYSWGYETFTVRAHGGARFYSASGTGTGVQLTAGTSSWGSISDRNAKENFADVDLDQLLETLAGMPVQTWNLRAQPDAMRHIGPVAQDFNGMFGYLFGEVESETYINNMDAVGISLAAAQGLYAQNEELQAQNATLRAEVDDLAARVTALEAGPATPSRISLLPWAGALLAGIGLGWVFKKDAIAAWFKGGQR